MKIFIHMTVYLVACCYFRLKLFYFQFFISELRLIDRVESEASHFTLQQRMKGSSSGSEPKQV